VVGGGLGVDQRKQAVAEHDRLRRLATRHFDQPDAIRP
jgi:hypothetical protein